MTNKQILLEAIEQMPEDLMFVIDKRNSDIVNIKIFSNGITERALTNHLRP